jgi:ATP-dependent DNA helicase RecG
MCAGEGAEPTTVALAPDGALALRGIGPTTLARLRAAGIATPLDLLWFFPRRYRPLQELPAPTEAALGTLVRLRGSVRGARLNWLPGRRSMVTVEFACADGTPFEIAFFNQPWLKKAWTVGSERAVEGMLEQKGRKWLLKQGRVLGVEAVTTGEVQLRYGDIDGVTGSRLQQWLAACLDGLDWPRVALPPLPAGLPGSASPPRELFMAMHRPATVAQHEQARAHFALREAVALFRKVERARRQRQQRPGLPFGVDAAVLARIAARIPFALTGDQQAAVAALQSRLAGSAPMGVLLQGDVGTGKTAVAVWAALAVIARGGQVAFLAPTELLAEQHHAEVARWLHGSSVQLELLTGAANQKARQDSSSRLASGEIDFVFGTHALLSASVAFHRLGLVVIDEQHRFGVEQRMQLVQKGPDPHVLVMTATPIPRTLALTLFGDLDVVTLQQRPPGRRLVRALSVAPERWARVLQSIRRAVRRGGRVFVVCPAVGEDGEKGGAVLVEQTLAAQFRTGLVHGRMPTAERQAAVAAFRDGRCDVLVGTTVLEVGVDVPAATLMVVVAADRFGIATLAPGAACASCAARAPRACAPSAVPPTASCWPRPTWPCAAAANCSARRRAASPSCARSIRSRISTCCWRRASP